MPSKRLLSVAAAVLFAVPVAATPAQAYPTDCFSGQGATLAKALCMSGTGSYQAYITCRNWLGWHEFKEGPWIRVGGGSWSYVYCSSGYSRVSNGIGIRNN